MLRGTGPGGEDGTRAGGPRSASPTDRANIVVVEAVMAALVLVGVVIFFLASSRGPESSGAPDEAADLRRQTQDALRLLDAASGNESRRSHLPTLVADALHGRTDELANRSDRLLPAGAEASFYLANGVGEQVLLDEGPAPDDTVGARQPFSPDWPTLHIVPELRVYPSDEEATMNVTALPLWGSTPQDQARLEEDNITFPNDHEAPLELDGDAPGTLENRSISNASADGGDGFPTDPEVTIGSNTTYREETLDGTAPYRTDDADVLSTANDAATGNLSDATLQADPDDVDVGGWTNVTWNLTPVSDAVDDHTTSGSDPEVHVAVFRPVPRDDPALPGHPAARDHPGGDVEGHLNLSLDRGAVVGRWMVVAQLNATLDTASGDLNQSVRLVDTFTVRTPASQGDPTALYDLGAVAWYEDW